jgi:hypothetical protein
MNRSRSLVIAGTALALATLLGPLPGFAAASTQENARPPLVIAGKGYSLSVLQPEGWQANEEAAKKTQALLAFSNGEVTILVRTRTKLNENVTLHLASDKLSVQKQFPGMESGPLDVKHPLYPTFPGMLSKPGELYVYLTYVNPGTHCPESVSVTMSKKKSPATPAELAAYRGVLASVKVTLEAKDEEDAQ